ncbi:citrate/2-methylcitrate synthase [Streptomyces sp. HB132]|uniref:citrate/2-methylcitrate synthase n=1 Tax=Streptomyces sp. HB132 TaxID=767388 RepID=UPI0019616DC3|nr:citrate/2-methylcitrate synthase [Streptomyces sp. HB132]MBM7440096.1 amino acid adenylation domain-containing protein [Streptomyces sp. HB132]
MGDGSFDRDPSGRDVTGLASGFLRNAREHADRTALMHDGQAWSYAQLLEEARRWASQVRECLSSQPAQRVGIFVHAGPVEHVGKIASLLAGLTFVPLNPKFPAQRLADMITQSNISIIIADSATVRELSEIYGLLINKPAVILPNDPGETLSRKIGATVIDSTDLARTAPLPLGDIAQPTSSDIAYIMFTSGSSGRPKGVPISHKNVRTYVRSAVQRYTVDHRDIFALTFDSTFDLSIFGPFVAWEVGAYAITMRPQDISDPAHFINENKVSVWLSVPSVAKTLIRGAALSPKSLPSLRYSLFCGEALPEYVASSWQRSAHNSTVINMYGPTEATISVSEYVWNSSISPDECVNGLVPIGQVYSGHRAAVVDEAGLEVATGERGELCIAGPQIFSGYLSGDRTSNYFLLRSECGEIVKYYRTGDICEVLGDGTIAYIARNDHQVKINGYRIELGDTEAALRALGATDAVAVPWPPEEPKCIVAATTGSTVTVAAAGKLLPPYMVPQKICEMEAMPLNVNGKTDRPAIVELLKKSVHPTANPPSPMSLDEVKFLVAQALGEGRGTISDHSHLHDPGSWDSLGHICVVTALETRLNVRIDPGHDHELRSVQGIFAFVQGRTGSRQVNRSLRGLLVTETSIAHSDVGNGSLSYSGYDLNDLLAAGAGFEQVAYLLLRGELPNDAQESAFQQQLALRRATPSVALEALRLCARVGSHPLPALVSAISLLNAEVSAARNGLSVQSPEEVEEAGLDLIAQLPTLLGAYHMLRRGKEPVAPKQEYSHVKNVLHMFGLPKSERNIDAITQDFIIHADNGTTASTYACMVANSAHTTVHAAVAAAAGVFSGARHGYASETSYAQLAGLKGRDGVKDYVERRLDAGALVDGIGHAIYGRAGDPRLAPYREVATRVARDEGNIDGLEKVMAMYDAARSKQNGAQPNYDLFGGLLYESLGLPIDLSTPLHVCYRIVGWIAHILEERATGQPLVRPDARYVGP